MLYMVFDVESVGLHGEGFAVGWVVVDDQGQELDAGYFACPIAEAWGTAADLAWVREHIPALPPTHQKLSALHTAFWERWLHWKTQGAVLVADCAWPVEARFLAACVDDPAEEAFYHSHAIDRTREGEGPYPLHDVATMLLAAGLDPLATVDRLPAELPQHDPLCDARQSARLWLEALHLLTAPVEWTAA